MRERRLTLSLAGAAALLATAAVWPWLPENAASRRLPETAHPAGQSDGIASLPPVARFSATVERPLFSPSRRPAATEQPSVPAVGIDGRYRLQGLITAGQQKRALIADAASSRRLEVGEGDSVEGWTVKRIEQDRLVLSSPAGEAILTLRRTGTPAPAKP